MKLCNTITLLFAILVTPFGIYNVDAVEYTLAEGACINGSNLSYLTDQTPHSCALACNLNDECEAFEFFREQQGPQRSYHGHAMTDGCCYLKSSQDDENCVGSDYNVDTYMQVREHPTCNGDTMHHFGFHTVWATCLAHPTCEVGPDTSGPIAIAMCPNGEEFRRWGKGGDETVTQAVGNCNYFYNNRSRRYGYNVYCPVRENFVHWGVGSEGLEQDIINCNYSYNNGSRRYRYNVYCPEDMNFAELPDPLQPITVSPTVSPTEVPTASPTASPTSSPTASPSSFPSSSPSLSPTASPTSSPTASPSSFPSSSPSLSPTVSPSSSPTASPSKSQSKSPSKLQSKPPSKSQPDPLQPITVSPTVSPLKLPTEVPASSTCSGLGCFEHTVPRQQGFYMLPGYLGMGTCHNRMNDNFRDGDGEEFKFDLEQCANACIDCHLNGNCGPFRDSALNFDDCGSWELNGSGACFLMPPPIVIEEHPDCFWHERVGLDYYVYVNGTVPTYTAVEGQERRHLRIKGTEKKL